MCWNDAMMRLSEQSVSFKNKTKHKEINACNWNSLLNKRFHIFVITFCIHLILKFIFVVGKKISLFCVYIFYCVNSVFSFWNTTRKTE